MSLLYENREPSEKKGAIRIIKRSEDGIVDKVTFTINGTAEESPSPAGRTGIINGWYITPENSGDNCDWIGIAQNGDYTLIVRTQPYEKNLRWGPAGNYIASDVRNTLEQRYSNSFPAKLKEAAAKSSAAGTGLEIGEDISVPEREAKSGDTDILFALSSGEYGAYLAQNRRYLFTRAYTRLPSPEYEAAGENASYLYNWGGDGRCWSRSKIYSDDFGVYMPVWYGYSVANPGVIEESGTYITPYSAELGAAYADLLGAMWVKTEKIRWSSTDLETVKKEISLNVTTGPDGTVYVGGLPEGSYRINEIADTEKYMPQDEKTETVRAGDVKTVIFENRLKRTSGTVTVHKTSEDGIIKGHTFILTGKENGIEYEAVTDERGEAVFREIPFGSYILTEEKKPEYTPVRMEVTLKSEDCDAEVNVRNELAEGQLTIIKQSAVQGDIPDGDACFEGIIFDLYAASDVNVYSEAGITGYKTGEK